MDRVIYNGPVTNDEEDDVAKKNMEPSDLELMIDLLGDFSAIYAGELEGQMKDSIGEIRAWAEDKLEELV